MESLEKMSPWSSLQRSEPNRAEDWTFIRRRGRLIQRQSLTLLPVHSAWVEAGGIVPSVCLKTVALQEIST